ncbi:heavy-metal-associated domain-containing protein [Paracoccus laeviglucosivorans]|uniref:Copper chaperone n=1 Tax=Paracoccus laeviglucosivorans TaxID=1197861 RepID=A0A521AAQ4_9RHOB|nr:heavy-metal-associated domain-containing protein [Paracoccus laeviglucosivorans]SMO31876.1 copper chaperone [Paracoccus laeviglucosivorans]
MKFRVMDMTCNHCTATIEQAVAKAGGTARPDLSLHLVEIEGLAPGRAEQVIRDAGYTPEPA